MTVLLIDSTVYIDLLRMGRDPVAALKPWIVRDEVVGCGVVHCEVLRGIVSKKVHQHMKALFEVLCPVDTDRMTWDDTADLAWELDRSGVVLPVTDLLIASCALRTGATVVSRDRHFRRVPTLNVLQELPPA